MIDLFSSSRRAWCITPMTLVARSGSISMYIFPSGHLYMIKSNLEAIYLPVSPIGLNITFVMIWTEFNVALHGNSYIFNIRVMQSFLLESLIHNHYTVPTKIPASKNSSPFVISSSYNSKLGNSSPTYRPWTSGKSVQTFIFQVTIFSSKLHLSNIMRTEQLQVKHKFVLIVF